MFKKIMAVTAVCAIAATMSVSAFAKTTPATDSITVTPSTTPAEQALYTVMLFKGDATATTIAVEDIYYINQGSVLSDLVSGMKVKATTVGTETTYLPVGNYTVRIGNSSGSVENITLVVEADVVTPTTFKITGYVKDKYATVTVGETTVNVDANGAFTLADLVDGAYDLIIKAPGALNRTVSATVSGADVAVSTADDKIELVYGATVADANSIGFSDLTAVKVNYNKKLGDAEYTLNCDLDRNDKIDFGDVTIVKVNYNLTIATAYGN